MHFGGALPMNSHIYKGWVRHRRFAPTQHRFRYRLFMLYVDLAELPQLFDATPFWSARRPAPAWFRRSDYFGSADRPLDQEVRDLVERRLGRRPAGPIRLLTHLRYFGYCMNPVSFYYCFNAAGSAVETIVAEITNTPWGERHQYVLDVGAAGVGGGATGSRHLRFRLDKEFHVSPFMPMAMQYHWSFSEPRQRLVVQIQNLAGGEPLFDATLSLRREPLTSRALVELLIGFPLMTLKVIAAIHYEALRLWFKKTPFFAHPSGTSAPGEEKS